MEWEDLELSKVKEASQRTELLRGFMQTSISDIVLQSSYVKKDTLIGVWRVEGLIAEGGMGAVYEVSRADGEFHQRAALKLMRSNHKDLRERFCAERERLASLEHHGISRVIDGGNSSNNEPYMIVELVDGDRIDHFVGKKRRSNSEVLKLLVKLLKAVGYAHERLILHRDIKPGNVLIDGKGEPRLIDFGVASILDTKEQRSGPLTIAYAAPELLSGEGLTLSTDLFSVGVLAYQLCTGTIPNRDADGAAVIKNDKLQNTDLFTILQKSTRADARSRYSSAADFAEDILAYLDCRPISSRKHLRRYTLQKFLQRNGMTSFLAATLVLSVLGGLVGTSIMAQKAANEAQSANAARIQAEYSLAKAQRNFRVQEAYGDALHRAFGGNGNAERVTKIVKARADQAYSLKNADPQRASEIIYAVGRNFVERNDYRTASEVLEPWIDEGFGDPALLIEGKLNLALAFRYQGQLKASVSLFKEVHEYYEATPDKNSYEHLVALEQYSSLTTEEELHDETYARLKDAVARGGTVEEMVFYYNSIARMKRLQGDFKGAEESTKLVHEVLEANPLVEIAGRQAIRINKAMYAIFVSQDIETARKDVDTLINTIAEENGESALTAYAYELSSAIALSNGNFERAIKDGQTASNTARRISGEGSDFHLGTTSAYVEALVAAGEYDTAESMLVELSHLVAQTTRQRDTRYALANAYYLAHTEGVEAARRWLDKENITEALTNRTPLYQYRMLRLKRMGV